MSPPIKSRTLEQRCKPTALFPVTALTGQFSSSQLPLQLHTLAHTFYWWQSPQTVPSQLLQAPVRLIIFLTRFAWSHRCYSA